MLNISHVIASGLGILLLVSCGSNSPTVTLKGGRPATFLASSGGNIDASVMKFKIYKFAASTAADCSSPVTIFDNADGVQSDMLTDPTFGTGGLTPGTYACVMVELSKVIVTAAATTSGFCTQDLAFNDVICQNGQTSKLIDGTAVTCSGDAANDQHVVLYISSISAGTSGNRALLPPLSLTDTTSGLKLDAAFTASSGSTTGTLTVEPRNFLQSGGGTCGTTAPSFAFN